MSQDYTYSLAADFPGGAINETNMHAEIDASAIATALEGVALAGDVVTITFAAALSAGDKTILDNDATGPSGGLIAAHDNAATPPIVVATLDDGEAGGAKLNLPEYTTTDPAAPDGGDAWILNAAGTRKFKFYDGANTHSVTLTQE